MVSSSIAAKVYAGFLNEKLDTSFSLPFMRSLVPGWAATCVRNVDASLLNIADGSRVRSPAGGNFAICQKYRTTPLTQVAAFPGSWCTTGASSSSRPWGGSGDQKFGF